MTPPPKPQAHRDPRAETVRRTLFVRNLELACAIGVHPHERGRRQRVVVNVELTIAEPDAAHLDRISSVVSYENTVDEIRRLADKEHVNLVETLAERIAALCLADRRVRHARVRVDKPDVYDGATSVGVEIERGYGE